MLNYNGQLNANLIISSLRNMIISQTNFGISTADPRLADYVRVDGTLYGDTKLYNSYDIGQLKMWADDEEGISPDRLSMNLLQTNRNKSPISQSIRMGIYKFTEITVDHHLSKQAYKEEGTFSEMISIFESSLKHIKRVYDNALINSEIGLHSSSAKGGELVVTPMKSDDVEAQNRLTGQAIAKELMILKSKMAENSRDYNELGYLRSYDTSSLTVIWNVEQKAKLLKIDLPTVFNNNGLSETGMKEFEIGAKWFGNRNEAPTAAGKGVRIAKGGWYEVVVNGTDADAVYIEDYEMLTEVEKSKCVYLYEGDVVPAFNEEIVDPARGLKIKSKAKKFPFTYTEDPDILFVIMDKESLPYMSALELQSEFFNPKSHTKNSYLVFGHNKLEWIKDKPFVKVKLDMPA